jgi:sugar phosphate isomerase/epimerase
MSLSSLPLSYCTNVHPGRSLAEVEAGLDRYTFPIRRAFDKDLAAGLWLAEPVVRELNSSPDDISRFAAGLALRGLSCHTLNAFPYGDFHDQRVKEKVYLPDWSDPRRLTYTGQCAAILAALLPAEIEGSISTLPLGFKGFSHAPQFTAACARQIIKCARALKRLRGETGRMIRLAIEPEPLCVLETTKEAIAFFDQLWRLAGEENGLDAARNHVGLCFDVCHQAIEFEDTAESIGALHRAGIRINKMHISCAIQLDDPASNQAGREALAKYIEPRYLHQVIAVVRDGRIVRETDLNAQLLTNPGEDFLSAPAWRIHFHVPVNAQRLGPLATTRPALKQALAAIEALDYAPHLEVETYTWEVLPGAERVDLVQGITRELNATDELINHR